MNEQQNLTFHLGMSDIPSDIACDDNALEESLGMLYDKGEHRPIQTPVSFATIKYTELLNPLYYYVSNLRLLYVHKFNNVARYIVAVKYNQTGQENPPVYYQIAVGVMGSGADADKIVLKEFLAKVENNSAYDRITYASDTQITTIGKTVIITNDDGINYFLWRNDQVKMYSFIGDKIPEPKIEFEMNGVTTHPDSDDSWYGVFSSAYTMKCSASEGSGYARKISVGKQEDWNNCAVGLYEKVRKSLKQKKCFFGPFCVRVALKLANGKYYMIGNPVLMLNTFDSECVVCWDGDNVKLRLYGQVLIFNAQYDYTDFSDIVKDVSLFVTREFELFETTNDAILDYATGLNKLDKYFIGSNLGSELYKAQYDYSVADKYAIFKRASTSDLKYLVEDGVYYHLCDIGLTHNDQNTWNSATYMESHVLENLTTQDRIDKEDFYSHCKLYPKMLFAYNNRLNITDVKRGFFEGFTQFLPYTKAINESEPTNKTYDYYVTIGTDSGEFIIKNSFQSKEKQGLYFYYPDRRAKHVLIVDVTTPSSPVGVLDEDLEESPSLNGAYYFYDIMLRTYLPPGSETAITEIIMPPTPTLPSPMPTPSTDPFEVLPNTVITSELNMAMVFFADGYNNVGNGRIIGMSSNTQALSEGQHGQFPLLVFTTEGIWALSVTSEGIYADKDPISREVALEDNPCLTQTDNAVFFASKKGLMRVDGSRVTCVSEQLRGFADVLKKAFIAYDYRQSILHIASDANGNSWHYIYVYSLADGTISRYIKALQPYAGVVNSYPDNLLYEKKTVGFAIQVNVYSLLEVPEETNDNTTYSGTLMSRPIKFGNGLTLKSLRDMKIIMDMQANASMVLTLMGSNDLKTWKTLTSFRGIPYKYFKIGLAFTGMKATDRLTGVATIVQERRTNKLR